MRDPFPTHVNVQWSYLSCFFIVPLPNFTVIGKSQDMRSPGGETGDSCARLILDIRDDTDRLCNIVEHNLLRPSNVKIVGIVIGVSGMIDTMTEIATAIASPRIQSTLCLQSTVEPLPARTVSLKERLRRDAKGSSSKGTPKGGILTAVDPCGPN
ncbi:MAG: hypothetical protein Q9194_003400 [Teloschistes cf. exilis]